MSYWTFIALYWLVFNSLFLCHVFVILFLQGSYLVSESNQYIAAFEVALTLAVAILGINRLIKVKEWK